MHQIPPVVTKSKKVLNQRTSTVWQAKNNLLFFMGQCYSLLMEPTVIPPTHCSCISRFTMEPGMLLDFSRIGGKRMMCQIIRDFNLSYIKRRKLSRQIMRFRLIWDCKRTRTTLPANEAISAGCLSQVCRQPQNKQEAIFIKVLFTSEKFSFWHTCQRSIF